MPFKGNGIKVSSSFSTITIYKIRPSEIEQVDSETLKNTPYEYFDKKITGEIFNDVIYYPDGDVVWKASFLAIAKLENDKEKRLRINFDGAYYTILGQKGFYETTLESRRLFGSKMQKAYAKWLVTK